MKREQLRERILHMRSELDAILLELEAPTASQDLPRYLSVPKFAELRGFNERTIREYCELGMPHVGSGKARRILVAEAIAWLEADGPKTARMARKRGNAA